MLSPREGVLFLRRFFDGEKEGDFPSNEGGTVYSVHKYFFRRCRKMAKNEARVKVTLVCSECKQRNYDTKKNKKNDPDRLEMNKFCRFCRKHTLHKESK